MEQRITLITLGVTDLPRSKAFYEQLGWTGQEAEETVFMQAGGSALVLWSRAKLAADSGVADSASTGFAGFTLAHNVRSSAEVDDIMTVAAAAGATVTRPASSTFYGGYAGCFADPDGYIWEIAHNPGFTLAADGSLTLPEF
ncbi:VOC family protein [Dactylosporangium sp. CS-047395]|uniref:VOC family protein n=1 Tax=Dactylosporangium sp. CS-047395 TaxID=3239936 RepID=UPI003D9209E3